VLAGAGAAVVPTTATSTAAEQQTRERWDTRVLAIVPRPGFPAYAYVHPNGRVYAGTYSNPLGDSAPSRVFEWTARGTLLRSWTVPGQDLSQPHGVQVAISDAAGRLVLLEKSTRRVMRLDMRTGRFTTYSRLPEGSIPNYAAWGRAGELFVSDYARGTIWRVPPGGGKARAWFSDPRLESEEFGTTGLVLGPDRRTLWISQQSSTSPDVADCPACGFLFRLAVRRDGSPGRMTRFWSSRPSELPDGFGIARSGRIYMALAGPSHQIVVINPDGSEHERFPEVPLGGDNGSPVPFDTPSNATFLGRRVVVANQSFVGNRDHHALLDVYVGERGEPVFVPRTAGR
jgi:sugar lactone lactonase YvrE